MDSVWEPRCISCETILELYRRAKEHCSANPQLALIEDNYVEHLKEAHSEVDREKLMERLS